MPRKKRQLSSTGIYHVMVRGADRQLLFVENQDYHKYLELLELYKDECNFKIYAYCLMSNHVHILIQTTDVSVSNIFQRIGTCYASWFNMKYNRTGFLQEGRFHSEPIEDERYLLNVVRYIHQNPLHAGLESIVGESYRWSSFFDYNQTNPRITDTDYILSIMCNIDNFSKFHELPSTDCLDINSLRRRLPDDVAQTIIKDECGCSTASDFQSLPILKQKSYLKLLHEKGISIRQLNRLTGTPLGLIRRYLN